MKKEVRPVRKHTLNLFEGDYEKLQSIYPDLGAGFIIRRLVSKHISQIEAAVPKVRLDELTVDV